MSPPLTTEGTMLQRLHRTTEIAPLLNIHRRTVADWASKGILRSVPVGQGQQKVIGFETLEVLIAALARDLQRRGFTLDQITHVTNWLRTSSLHDLQEQWSRGKNFLFCIGGFPPCPRLLSQADIFDNGEIDLSAALAAGVAIALIDTETAYRQLLERLNEGEADHRVAVKGAAGE
jgi:DNA-binding transcriptional MerR regulator